MNGTALSYSTLSFFIFFMNDREDELPLTKSLIFLHMSGGTYNILNQQSARFPGTKRCTYVITLTNFPERLMLKRSTG